MKKMIRVLACAVAIGLHAGNDNAKLSDQQSETKKKEEAQETCVSRDCEKNAKPYFAIRTESRLDLSQLMIQLKTKEKNQYGEPYCIVNAWPVRSDNENRVRNAILLGKARK